MRDFLRRLITKQNIALVVLIALLAFAVWQLSEREEVARFVKTLFNTVSTYDQRFAAGVFILLAALSAAFTFFTSTPLIPFAVALWGGELTFVFLFGGWILGGTIAYGIGRVAAHLIEDFKFFKKVEHYSEHLDVKSRFPLIVLFRLAVPTEIASYTLGVLRYPFIKSILANGISDAPFAVLALFSTEALFHSSPVQFIGFMTLGLVVMSACLYLFYRAVRGTPPSQG